MAPELNRRSFLRGAGGVAIGLPFLEALAPARAFAQAAPRRKRLIIFQIPNGVIRENWFPQSPDGDFTLSRILTPLAAHKNDLTIMRHVDNVSATTHNVVPTLTGIAAPGPRATSIDQIVGDALPGTAFRSLQFAVNCQKSYCTFKDGQPVPPENFPEKMFERMFGAKPGGVPDRSYEYRKSVLDGVKESIDRLRPQIAASDRARLDRHLASIRSIEKRLTGPPMVLDVAGCKPAAPPMVQVRTGGYRYDGKYNLVGEAQIPLMVQAIACGISNVATIQWSDTFANAPHWQFMGIAAGEHEIHHGSDPNKREVRTRELEYYVTQFEKLISGLKACPEPGGSVFTNSLVVFCSEMGDGISHDTRDMPYLLAGSAGGALKTGRVVDARGAKNTQLLVTLVQALLGREPAALPPFGDPKYFGNIPGLLA